MIDRREAVKRIAVILGYSLSGPTLAGVLSGCRTPSGASTWRAFTPELRVLLDAVTERIIPTTDTPGAHAAGVTDFIETMLADFFEVDPRERFLEGLRDIDARAKAAQGKAFLDLDETSQFALLDAMDAEVFPDLAGLSEAEREAYRVRMAGEGRPFFARLKELTVAGYYTSEIGATQELHVNPMGTHRGDIPYAEVGRAWA
jgi:hypothetical protein